MKKRSCKLIIFIILLFIATFVFTGVSYFYFVIDDNEVGYSFSNTSSNVLLTDSDEIIAASTSISTSVNGDLVTLSYSGTGTFAYGTSSSTASSTYITTVGGARTTSNGTTKGYVSLPNGSYYFAFINATNLSTTAVSSKVTVSNSCSNETKTNQTGSFSLQRCYIVDSSNNATPAASGDIATCASGYTLSYTADVSACKNLSFNSGVTKRYCKVTFNVTCTKKSSSSSSGSSSVAAASLTALSVSSGSLSPSFKSGTKKYTVSVGADVSSIKVSATAASGSSFVSGYGSRTVSLNYGSNTIKVKVKNSAGSTTTYTITVTRADNRSSVNTLSNLTVSAGTLSPAFSSGTTNYTVDVDNSVSSINIGATLTDSSSKFASGYGPGSYPLEEGANKIYIKVVSENGSTNVYNITVNRSTENSVCSTDTSSLALLKQIDLSVDISGLEIDQIEDFDSNTFTYDNIKVPYKVTNLIVTPYVQTEGDTTVVEGADDLEVNVIKEIKITVTSKECPNYTNVYTLNVTRQPEQTLGDNAELSNITIENHDEFEFESNVLEYKLTLKKGEDVLNISYEKALDTTVCDIQDNEDLAYGSVVTISCVSEDGEDSVNYTITIDGVEKGTNAFLIIIVVIIIILILIYLVLRMLGYRIYFNFAVIGSFFRGIGEKIKNIFDK